MSNNTIEILMARSFDGEKSAAEEFFARFSSFIFYTPERYQAQALSDSPEYPNDFVNVLGVRQGDTAVVPVFSAAEYIQDWSGQPFSYKKLTGAELLNLIPEGWWISLNPGQEIEKEISPWEIELLKGGEQNISALIDEIFPAEKVETLAVHSVEDDEYPGLKEALLKCTEKEKEVVSLYLLKEYGENIDGEKVSTALVGVKTDTDQQERLDSIQSALTVIAQQAQIGGDRVKVMVSGAKEDGLMLGMFAKATPFYTRPVAQKLINRIASKIRLFD